MNKTYYAGIGSRDIPKSVQNFFIGLGKYYAKQGFVLRSGAAEGSDSAFETGCILEKGEKEIFLPWKGFNTHTSPLYEISAEAEKIASEVHPAWDALSQGAKKLHSRNVYQVLGYDLKTPVKFVACYTKDGIIKGGTATAINLAQKYNIPIFNYGLIFHG